jgi:KDO2-lipid IV(A) lauroyltransferase
MDRLFFALLWLLRFLPLPIIHALGGVTGTASFWMRGERRRITLINLALCFPHLSTAARRQLARAHFRAFSRSFLAFGLWWWAPRRRIEQLVRVDGLEHLRSLAGRPVLLLALHFVGMDAGATRLSLEVDGVGIYNRRRDPRFAALLARGRSRFGDQVLIARQDGIRPALRAMQNGRPLYYLPDQDYLARDSIFVPLFGVQAATVTAPSRIARMTGARVVPCTVRMLPWGRGYVVRIEAPWTNYPTSDAEADARRLNAFIEACVREMPEQYVWMHKRFKTRPAGEPSIY